MQDTSLPLAATALPSDSPNLPDIQLSAIEARILGALMEKQLTTPDTYPLTLNSLLLACNQKTSREPVSHYSQGEVQNSLNSLQEQKLVDTDWGARAARYDQRLTRVISMDKHAQALLCIMLLRGPQTLGELLTRTQRMADFASTSAIEETLQHLCNKTQPVFIRLPRLSGQREERFMHLFCGLPDASAFATSAPAHSAPIASEQTQELAGRIETLENKVAQLEQQIAQLLATQ